MAVLLLLIFDYYSFNKDVLVLILGQVLYYDSILIPTN